jgi:hypothetical protein
MIAANNDHLLAFDNLSGLCPWLSDALCRLASGGSFVVRQLYTNDEEVLFKAAHPLERHRRCHWPAGFGRSGDTAKRNFDHECKKTFATKSVSLERTGQSISTTSIGWPPVSTVSSSSENATQPQVEVLPHRSGWVRTAWLKAQTMLTVLT